MIKAEYLLLDSSDQLPSDVDEKALIRRLSLDDAYSPFYLLAEKVKAKKLKRRDAKHASATLCSAIANDPAARYIRDTLDARPKWLERQNDRIQTTLSARLWARKKVALTVNHGRSVVVGLSAPADRRRRKSDERIGKVLAILFRAMNLVAQSKEQRRRFSEATQAMEEAATTCLGSSMLQMRSIASLATDPCYQRRGYATALLNSLCELADSERRSTWLFSSNQKNDAFYESFGFVRLGEAVIGRDNPTWKGEPVSMSLMVRVYEDQFC